MADPKNRPLSPHLQIYKPQITSMLSILHRITGMALVFGLPVLVWFLHEVAYGTLETSLFATIFFSFIGKMMLLGWTFCLAYHLCNGIRHLFWDIGYGFELDQLRKTGWAVIIGSIALTIIAWACVIGQGGFSS